MNLWSSLVLMWSFLTSVFTAFFLDLGWCGRSNTSFISWCGDLLTSSGVFYRLARFKICVGVFPVCLLSHARLRCMCTCNRCTFCLCQNFLNSELLQMVRAKLYTVVLRRSLISYNHLHLWLHVIIIPSLSHPFLFFSVFLAHCFMFCSVSSTFLFYLESFGVSLLI